MTDTDTEDLLEPSKPQHPLSTAQVRERLRAKFPPDQYAMLQEVRDAAGFGASRNADVIMVGLWPSRGCLIEGMEIKVSRSDWLRELKKPQKAEAFFEFCDRWWVVVSSADIVRPGELPPTWGLMVARGKGIRVDVEAPALTPKPVDRSLLAAMLKRATSTSMKAPEIQAEIARRVAEAEQRASAREEMNRSRAAAKLEYLERAVRDFEAASGVKIETYQAGDIGRAVKAVLASEHESRMKAVGRIHNDLRRALAWFDENFPEAPEPPDGA